MNYINAIATVSKPIMIQKQMALYTFVVIGSSVGS